MPKSGAKTGLNEIKDLEQSLLLREFVTSASGWPTTWPFSSLDVILHNAHYAQLMTWLRRLARRSAALEGQPAFM
jgi:hypothetical protein